VPDTNRSRGEKFGEGRALNGEGHDNDSTGAARLVLFETLFHSHADVVLAYAARRSDPDTAEEIVAETFAIAWRRFADIPDPALPWFLGVARRVLANSRRTASRRQALARRLVEEPHIVTQDPTEEVDARLSALAAFDLLSSAERETIELLAWEGLSAREAASVLGCSRGVIAVRIHRARRRLRRHLSEALDPVERPSETSIATSAEAGASQTNETQEVRRP
jgi:RNA polymerase sigma-70 factor (ECF subfamily)